MRTASFKSGLKGSTSNDLLEAWEAALYLGITPELLFYYTSNNFRKRPGEKRYLITVQSNGSTRFPVQALDAFDDYLWEPWAEVGEPRRDMPQKLFAYLNAESAGACVRCGSGIAVETAHIESWSTSRCNHHHNLLRICSACHSEHDMHKSVSTEELLKLKSVGVERLRESLRRRMNIGQKFPAPTADIFFVGRTRELENIRDALRLDRYVLVHGAGGIGKTQLILNSLQVANTGRPVLWIEAERYGSVEAMRASLEVSIRSGMSAESDSLESSLDKMQACLVVDGLEQLRTSGIDAFDDWIAQLQNSLSVAQIVVTSQADLHQARFDSHVRLVGIDIDSSREMVSYFLKTKTSVDSSSFGEIVSFADGHPLTLRLAAMLINYFGSSSIAWELIQQRGTDLLEIQKRSSQNRHTSLRTCLSLAYDALTEDERKLLYIVANAPGGLFSSALVAGGPHRVRDGRAAIAAARRWALLEMEQQGERRERVRLLSPIAGYLKARWQEERPDEAWALTRNSAVEFSVMAAVIGQHAHNDDGMAHMLSRFEEELPNLIWVLDLAEKTSADAELGELACAVCSALMRYFFVVRLGDIGSLIMLRGARIAIRDGFTKRATNLVTQMIGLIQRNGDRAAIAPALKLLEEVEKVAKDAESLSDIAICRAIVGNLQGQYGETVKETRSAIALLEKAITAGKNRFSKDASADEDINNDLSSAYQLLADALLAQQVHEDAKEAYIKVLVLARGAHATVNKGQLNHQIGNCEANLKHLDQAAIRYMAAARQFRSIGMRDYLGNALGEFGKLLLEFDAAATWPDLPNAELIKDGILDVAQAIYRSFGQYPFNLGQCAGSLSNLFGLIVLISFAGDSTSLAFPSNLKSDLLPWAEAAFEKADEIWWDELGGEVIGELGPLLNLETAITRFKAIAQGPIPSELNITGLVSACKALRYHRRSQGLNWLFIYLQRRWHVPIDTIDELKRKINHTAGDEQIIVALNSIKR
jgi:tetratricopeptide (TPR) repeat protein